MNASQVISVLRGKGWKVFTRPYELNIVGVRSDSTKPNSFDDMIVVFFRDGSGGLVSKYYPATTDPGTYWLRQPMNPQGTAILAQGQYVDAYKLGLHRGQYTALVEAGQVTAIRDYDRDAVLDFANGTVTTGSFGINIHHARSSGTTRTVDKYSAGCQVFARFDDFLEFIKLCQRHRELHGNTFTYTLIDQRAIKRTSRKRLVVVSSIIVSALAIALAAHSLTPKPNTI